MQGPTLSFILKLWKVLGQMFEGPLEAKGWWCRNSWQLDSDVSNRDERNNCVKE